MKVAVIGGTGPQGLGIAKRFAIEGVEVIVGSRKEEKALTVVEETIEELKDYDLNIVGMANEDAAKAGGTVSNVNYLSGADNVLIPRELWGCGMSNINIKNGLCPGGAVRMERLADLALYGRQDPELLVTHKFKGLEKIEDALLLMKEKPKDLIKPVVMLDLD